MAAVSSRCAAALIVLAALGASGAQAGECSARSSASTTPLVELYTARRCSGCGDAERWLSALGQRLAARVLPVLLHVDVWEYLAERDPRLAARSSRRERNLLLRQRMALVYTPQVLLQGREVREWASPAFDRALERIAGQRALARLTLRIDEITPQRIAASLEGEILDPAGRADAALYVGAMRDRAVLQWLGPFPAGDDGRFAYAWRLEPPPGARPSSAGVAAFVQNRRTGEVLQALSLAACSS